MPHESIDNEYAKFHIEDGVLFFTYKPNIYIDIDAAKRIVADRLKLQDGKSYNVICDIRQMKGADKKARDYLALEGSEKVERVALIIASPALKVMSNFYLKVNKPVVPTKIFTSREEAFDYIREFA